MAGRPSGFKAAAARAQYCALYDEAIAQSPVPVEESDILTSFGATHVLTAGDATMPPLVALVGGAKKSMATGVVASADDVVTWIDEVLDALAIGRCQVAGASIGAWMAANYAMARPATCASCVPASGAASIGLRQAPYRC